MKKFLMLLAAAVLLFPFCGCDRSSPEGTQKHWKIGVSIPAATHGWSGGVVWHAYRAEEKMEKENPGVDILISTSANEQEQADRIENLIVRGVDALVVMAQDPKQLQRVCEKAKKKGIYLVIVSNPLENPVQDVFVNGDNTGFGIAAAEAMGQVLNGKGKIVVMEGYNSPINTERNEAFRRTLAARYPGIEILASRLAEYNKDKALALMENYFQLFPDRIDGVWAGDDDALLGALKACQERKEHSVKAMIGGGGSRPVIKMILDKDPLVRATVTYSPAMIVEGMKAALDGLNNGKTPPSGRNVINCPSEIVLPENAAKYYEPDSVY